MGLLIQRVEGEMASGVKSSTAGVKLGGSLDDDAAIEAGSELAPNKAHMPESMVSDLNHTEVGTGPVLGQPVFSSNRDTAGSL